MKKVLLTLAVILSLSFTNEKIIDEITYPEECAENSVRILTDCSYDCWTFGDRISDTFIINTRRPTFQERLDIIAQENERCAQEGQLTLTP
ncbi:hypothetical protein AAU57_11675 [Nonlabens sp. YIK11]|uniref:hypothetical protein n=1 Tax=Nonlabens sp. YIK11 TaxID=1453349 RepID=UPI000707EDE2|nr:hypothetical protein [Nonlabens sp. YIK11]KQC33916.1 hypothetical protein AAU57_11675 [Nonlabens sp. YIK11]